MQSSGPMVRLRSPQPLTAALGGHYAQKLFMTESEISENRKTEYEQVCESHPTITVFAPSNSSNRFRHRTSFGVQGR